MKGETTIDERAARRLLHLELVRKFYSERYTGLDKTGWESDLIAALIEDAAYLACYYGVDLETLTEDVIKSVRDNFPDVP